MPARRKPTSTRQKKADTQLKRAIKRGDIPAPSPDTKKQHLKARRRGPTGNLIGSSASDPAIQAARRLQSAFITLPPNFLEETKQLASTLPLPRPIPADAVIFVHPTDANAVLSCPRRPKWRFDMSKKEVEHNEEGVFKKWLEDTDGVINKWQNHKENDFHDLSGEDHSILESSTMPRSPTFFERNLEVWRQLWRVTEISQILLVLLDSRCPLLHFPPSLASYLSGRKVILVLTKVDLCGPVRAKAWTDYFHKHYPHLRVVQVESYVEKSSSHLQGHKHYEPHLPITFRERLVEEIKAVHAEMLQPPDKVKANPKWLQQWQPSIKRDIDWAGVMHAGGSIVGSIVNEAAYARKSNEEEEDSVDASTTAQEPEFLTIGLIGQPNVGKSSLLNALFGASRVRASKTPGKTKHFQTLFWTPDVRLVDCPGLVMPSFIPMEMQVLSGILPISRVSAVPSCTHYACQFLPLERIYNLAHPSLALPEVEDKRTWRAGEGTRTETKQTNITWTAMDILVAFADAKGWITAKAGRPDIHRAGNAVLRALAEGRIRWAFWPPDATIGEVRKEQETDIGIWIAGDNVVGEDTEEESEPDERDKGVSKDSGEDELTAGGDNDYDSDAPDKDDMAREVGTRFEVLVLDDELIADDENNGDETN